eukprot:snap_masked-scaffold_41-processed-gene-2.77-mRNA-1 protein AED:1.00 eAED:1.00 QI:0/-1/0/0/-1/1/1/0/224
MRNFNELLRISEDSSRSNYSLKTSPITYAKRNNRFGYQKKKRSTWKTNETTQRPLSRRAVSVHPVLQDIKRSLKQVDNLDVQPKLRGKESKPGLSTSSQRRNSIKREIGIHCVEHGRFTMEAKTREEPMQVISNYLNTLPEEEFLTELDQVTGNHSYPDAAMHWLRTQRKESTKSKEQAKNPISRRRSTLNCNALPFYPNKTQWQKLKTLNPNAKPYFPMAQYY